jgi:ATP-dependent Clp protease protease subunit
MKHTKDDDDDIDDIIKDSKPLTYGFYKETLIQRIYHFYLNDIIGDPDQYTDMIHIIRTAQESDTVFIHLNTPGGVLTTGVQIINAMQITDAHVICSLEGECASLGTIIFLSADEFVVHDNSLFMIHNFSGGVFGKGNEQMAQVEAMVKWFNSLAKRIYVPFLSEQELDKILKGEDLWLQAEDIRRRLTKMLNTIKKQNIAKASKSTKTKKHQEPTTEVD